MIIGKNTAIPVLILLLLFTSLFVSIASISQMPEKIMGGKDIYVLTSSTDRNPLRSNLDIKIAYGIENMSYIEAVSPEIFVFTTINHRPITIRGVIFSKLIGLENGKIVNGSYPREYGDALIGCRAQKYLNVKIGEKLTLIGAFTSSVAIVNITGVYRSDSPTDDEILVDLPTARKLAGIGEDQISIIRIKSRDKGMLEKLMSPRYPKFTVTLNVSSESYVGDTINVTAVIDNLGLESGRCNLTLMWNGERIEYENIQVAREKIVNVEITAPQTSGNYTLSATVENYLMRYTYTAEIDVKKKPIFVRGPMNLIVNTSGKFYISSLGESNLRDVSVEILGENYHRNFTVDSPMNLSLPQSGNYTLRFHKQGYREDAIEIRVYRKVEMENIATISPLYGGTIILLKGERLHVATEGRIFYSLDNSSLREAEEYISFPPYLLGSHRINITVIEGDMLAWKNLPLLVLESYSPRIVCLHSSNHVYHGEKVTFRIMDTVPIQNATLHYEKREIEYRIHEKLNPEKENYTFNITAAMNSSGTVKIYFSDILGRIYNSTFHFTILYQRDIVPPRIIVDRKIRIWSGNTTIVRATDNVAVNNISVFIFNRYFNSTSSSVKIPTLFWENGVPHYIPPGAYTGKIFASDVNNNTNSTTFTVIISNLNEKIPPIITGPSVANLSSGSVTFHAFDNVGVKEIACYENSSLLAYSSTSQLVLTGENITSGLHHVIIMAEDVNGNMAAMDATLFRNYHDTALPIITLSHPVVWSGTAVKVMAKDNVGIKKLRVYFPYLHENFTGHSAVKVPTMLESNDSVWFLPQGNYTLEIWATDVYGNVNHTQLTFSVDNRNEEIPPIIKGPPIADLSNSSPPVYRAFDNVGVKRMLLLYDNSTILETSGDALVLNISDIPEKYTGTLHALLYAQDVNGNMAVKEIIIQVPDIHPPRIIVDREIRIWSGNTTIVRATDNVAVNNISVFIFNRYFNSTSSSVKIPTLFWENGVPHYIPPGAYTGKIFASDVNNNTNSTTFTVIISNLNEKIPPIITGPTFQVLSFNSSASYVAYDNSFISRIWAEENGREIKLFYGCILNISYRNLNPGYHNITIYAEDIYGNTGALNATLLLEPGPVPEEVDISISQEKMTPDTSPILTVTLKNGDVTGYYNLTVIVDGKTRLWKWVLLKSREIKIVYIKLPPMSVGTHTISVGGQELEVEVVEKKMILPLDTVLKYAKNLKISGSKDVIYRGFQISEGNVMLTFLSLIAITMILVFFGVYYSSVKGMKISNIGVLRAIGASNEDIRRFLWKDVAKYLVPSVVGGVLLGYLLTILLNRLQILLAFGHQLIISPSPILLVEILLISLFFIIISFMLIMRKITTARVVHLLGSERNERITTLEEVLQ